MKLTTLRPYYLRDDEDDCQCISMGLEERHEERYECKVCGKCCADEVTLAQSFDTYDDKGTCIGCSIKDGMTIETIAGIVNRD